MRSLEHYRGRFVFIPKFLGDLFLTIAISWYLRDGPLENLWGGGGVGEVQKQKIRARKT